MKISFIVAAVTLSISSFAFAGDYTDAADQQSKCDEWGKAAAIVYVKHHRPGSDGLENILAANQTYSSSSKSAMDGVILYASSGAMNKKEAYMHAWGVCMDEGQ